MAAQFKTLLVVVFMVSASSAVKITDENEAWRWLTEYSEKASVISNEGSKISWKYATNITDENERRQVCQVLICFALFYSMSELVKVQPQERTDNSI